MGKAAKKTTSIEDWEKSFVIKSAKRMYASAVVSLGWQLALAVLVPVIIGNWLDNRYKTGSSYTLAALILSACGAIYIVNKTVKEVNQRTNNLKGGKSRV